MSSRAEHATGETAMGKNQSTNDVTRRTVIAGAAGLAAGFAPSAQAAREAQATQVARRPNFLFIMADDLGFADLSCYGRTEYQTPELDRLAREGMRFTSAYSNSAVCTATRVGLITGRYQYRLPIGLEEPLAFRDIGLPPSHPTIASLLRAAGYQTSLIRKWHLGLRPKYDPLKSGYDVFWGLRGGGVLRGSTLPERSLYWRYKFNDQAAVRRGNWKYLKIRKNSFLFDVVADPMERANLKTRQPEKFKELETAWAAWNATMVPFDPDSLSLGTTGDEQADRFGVEH